MTKEQRDREDQGLLRYIADETRAHPFGARVRMSPARTRLRKAGLIRHFLAVGKAGNPHRWVLTPAGREAIQ